MRTQGGINNADLFGVSQRSARSKLEIMGGIQRNPRGILASSPELMQAAAPRPMAPAPMTPPPMMPMVQPALPQVPMQTAVAPMVQQASMNPMQQAPVVPTVPQPASPTTPMKFKEAGPVDITKTPTSSRMTNLQLAMFSAGAGIYEKVLGKYGSEEKVKQEIVKKKDEIEEVTSKTKDPVEISNTVLTSMGEEPTDENKRDVAANVFGLENVNDIDAINDRIAKVAVASTIGGGTQGTDKLASALLLGLQNYKQTAAARASGGGSSFTKDRTALRAYQDSYDSLMKLSDRDLPEGFDGTVAEYARQEALRTVLQTYPREQIPAQLLNQGGGPQQSDPSSTPTLEQFLEAAKAAPKNKGLSIEELTEYYNTEYGG